MTAPWELTDHETALYERACAVVLELNHTLADRGVRTNRYAVLSHGGPEHLLPPLAPRTAAPVLWLRNGDHPNDGPAHQEGKIVRYFRHPDRPGHHICPRCGHLAEAHGWIDSGGDGQTVCPGDYVPADLTGWTAEPVDGAPAVVFAQEAWIGTPGSPCSEGWTFVGQVPNGKDQSLMSGDETRSPDEDTCHTMTFGDTTAVVRGSGTFTPEVAEALGFLADAAKRKFASEGPTIRQLTFDALADGLSRCGIELALRHRVTVGNRILRALDDAGHLATPLPRHARATDEGLRVPVARGDGDVLTSDTDEPTHTLDISMPPERAEALVAEAAKHDQDVVVSIEMRAPAPLAARIELADSNPEEADRG